MLPPIRASIWVRLMLSAPPLARSRMSTAVPPSTDRVSPLVPAPSVADKPPSDVIPSLALMPVSARRLALKAPVGPSLTSVMVTRMAWTELLSPSEARTPTS